MKKILYMIIIVFAASACNNFLDVNPKSKFTDDDMFSSAEGIEDALYGVYAFMGSTEYLYASIFTIAYPEFSSGNFYITDASGVGYLIHGDWEYEQVYVIRRRTWTNAYKAIGYANNIINHFEDDDVIISRYNDLYFGEALGLRAMMHFDLLRVYGPAAWTTDQKAKEKVIPYVMRYSYEITPYSSYDEVYSYIIADLVKAESLLAADEELMAAERDNLADGFISCRMIHMNLYAVQALLARVYWTKGELDKAAEYAEKVISSNKFPLMGVSDFINFERGAINMKETIFGLYSTKYIDFCNTRFKIDASGIEIADYASLYADKGPDPGVDYRLTYWFEQNACVKMVNSKYISGAQDYTGLSIVGLSITRIPEMYYIMAEYYLENNNMDKAIEYIDYVIESRGMVKFADRDPKALTLDDLYNEYRKEFYGEGQQWYNMKRLKKNIRLKNYTLTASEAIYNVPIPSDIEDDLRED